MLQFGLDMLYLGLHLFEIKDIRHFICKIAIIKIVSKLTQTTCYYQNQCQLANAE